VENQEGHVGKTWDEFGETISKGQGYLEKSWMDGTKWIKKVVVFETRKGMDGWMKEFPLDQRYIIRDIEC
jgi:hypothetical protein